MKRRSCCSLMMLCLLAAVDITLVGYKHIQNELINKLADEQNILELDERKTDLSLKHLDLKLQNMKMLMNITKTEVEKLQGEIKKLVLDQKVKAEETKDCQNSLVTINEKITAMEKEKRLYDSDGHFAALKSKWSELIKNLKKQLQEPSILCTYVKTSDANGQCPQTAVKNQTTKGLMKDASLIQTL